MRSSCENLLNKFYVLKKKVTQTYSYCHSICPDMNLNKLDLNLRLFKRDLMSKLLHIIYLPVYYEVEPSDWTRTVTSGIILSFYRDYIKIHLCFAHMLFELYHQCSLHSTFKWGNILGLQIDINFNSLLRSIVVNRNEYKQNEFQSKDR